MSEPSTPTPDAWERLITDIDLATHGELISALAARMEISTDEATDAIDHAIETGVLVPDESDGAFTEWTVAETDEDGAADTAEEPRDEQIDDAFAELIDFCQQLDRPLPDDCEYETPRAALIEGRGWDPQTIEDKQLGYAPASQTALLDHLMGKGYDRETILGTGLFWDDLTPIWRGRHVWPYFDTDGEQPVYAIARAMGHPADRAGDYGDGPAKYHKIPTTRDAVDVEEPIYGRATIVDGAPLIITEGIADAITAHEAGYPCLSPVTKQFKKQHHSVLLDLIEEHDIPRVYILQDAEVATITPKDTGDDDPPTISEALHIEQYGEGLRGAIETAAYLDDNDVPAFIGEFPRSGTEKVDLDDWLQEWGETLDPILKSAKPVDEHRAFDPKAHAIESASDHPDPDPTPHNSDGRRSALFDLDIEDVTGFELGDRGTNPLGHHGTSENYFTVHEKNGSNVAYDHKYKVAYNALTYLLCEAGERRPDSPNGRLSDAEILAAWLYAKHERLIADDDPIPRRALRSVAIEHDLCEQGEIEDGWKLPRAAYDDAIAFVEEKHGVDAGREPIADGWTDDDGEDEDLTELAVVLDPERAWRAAGQITPADLRVYDDLDAVEPLSLAVTDDESGWCCPQCAGAVGIVQAVAIDRGTIDCCEQPLRDDDYDTAYYRARTAYGAPLPEFVSHETATDNWALVQGSVSQLTHFHLSGTESTVTGDGGNDADVIAELDPCWADSASGQRIIAFRSGNFYCREHECAIDPLRFVALEHGLIEHCDDALEGEAFTKAYHIAREQYGAPLPEWETGAPDHVPVLPDADDLLGEFSTDTDSLDAAREAVTELVRSHTTDATTAHVVTTLPALGKTTAIVILAAESPALYLAPRRELMAEVEQKAEKWGRSCQHLPIFAATPPSDGAIAEALELVREADKQLLREQEALVERIDAPIQDGEDDEDEADADSLPILDPETEYPTVEAAHEDGYRSLSAARQAIETKNTQRAAMAEEQAAAADDEIDLDRASCPCANGEHGAAWQLVVAVARALGHTPQEIHTRDEALFGETLPCHAEGECEYALGWERATDPGTPKDILIGHYGHGHVNGARVHRARDADEHVRTTRRTIALDEFPGDTYDRVFDAEFVDHAAWAARALCPEVDDRQALFEQDLGADDTLRAWIDGTATDANDAFAATDERLGLMSELTDAYTAAEDIRETLAGTEQRTVDQADAADTRATTETLIEALDDVLALAPEWDGEALEAAHTTLRAAVSEAADHKELFTACQQLQSDVLPALASGGASGADGDRLGESVAPDRCGDDLTDIVERAVTAFCEQRDGTQGFIHAARTVLAGGEDGCRELALHSDDGYAHPMASLLLDGLISETTGPSASGGRSIIPTDAFDFEDDDADGEDGTNLARTQNGRHTILTDRNHHGALIRDPPAFHGDDETAPNPVIGLDATGRESLWELAIGCPVETADIHETPREKRAFLQDVLNLQVVQTSPHVQSYSGSPDSTNFDGPVALVDQIAEEYSASLLRRDTLSSTTKPGVITTKKAEGAIADRITGQIGALEHYGDITGSNALGNHNLGVVLGSRHFGDAPVEKWAALAGETVTREGKGADLDYGCPIGNAFLKYMRDDETLQAILRFGRDEEGAVVFAHTSVLAECLPVVAEGQVVKTFTDNGRAITDVARQYRGTRFEISDLVDEVECSRETVRRTLNEFTVFGYLTKHEAKNGLATGYEALEEPGAGEVELPTLDDPFTPDGPPDRGGDGADDDLHGSSITRCYMWNVEVGADEQSDSTRRKSRRATLPAPEKIAAGPSQN